jgi:hypothetical protein
VNPSEIHIDTPVFPLQSSGLEVFRRAIPDFELWVRNRNVAADDAMQAQQLNELRYCCSNLWTVPDATVEADVVLSVSALSTSFLDNLARHVRVGGVILAVDEYTLSMGSRRFEAIVAPTALEVVRRTLPTALLFSSRNRRPVSCILRRRN